MHKTNILITLAALLLAVLTSCGGSSGFTPDTLPAPGTADLTGQLVEGGRGVSNAGGSLGGVDVSLIDALTGALLRSGVTDVTGRFEFKAVPSGDTMLLKIEFTSDSDLDNDGAPDQIELSFPLDLADQSKCEVRQEIDLTDSDADGKEDSVEVNTEVSDDRGRDEKQRRRHDHKRGETTDDTNRNGEFDGRDKKFDDNDCNGLPDKKERGEGKEERFAEVRARGAIDEITDTSITVGGVTFTITDATRLRNGSSNKATPADFAAGDLVVVKGFTNADGELIALKIRSQHGNNGVDDEFGHDPGNSGEHDPDVDNDGKPDGDDGGGEDNSGDEPKDDDGNDDDSGDDDVDNDGKPDGDDDPSGDDGTGDDPNGGDGDPDNDGGDGVDDDPSGDDGDDPADDTEEDPSDDNGGDNPDGT